MIHEILNIPTTHPQEMSKTHTMEEQEIRKRTSTDHKYPPKDSEKNHKKFPTES